MLSETHVRRVEMEGKKEAIGRLRTHDAHAWKSSKVREKTCYSFKVNAATDMWDTQFPTSVLAYVKTCMLIISHCCDVEHVHPGLPAVVLSVHGAESSLVLHL